MDKQILIEDFQNICRICATSESLQPLEKHNFIDLLQNISNIELKAEGLPKNVCKWCFEELEHIITFIEKYRRTTDILQNILQEKETTFEIKEEHEDSLDISEHYISSDLCIDKEEDVIEPVLNISDILTKINEWEHLPFDEDSKCQVCNEKLTKKNSKSHYQRNVNCLPSFCKCPICDKHLYPRTKKSVENHLLSHKKSGNYKCPECKITHLNPKSLRQHVLKMHKGSKPFNCEICKKGFLLKRSLDEHMNFHNGSTPYVCSYCGEGFKRQTIHAKHVYHAHNIEAKKLPKLSRKYTEKRVHLSLECKECGKVLASRSGFEHHQLIHQGVLNFLCNVCGKKFVTKAGLDAHIFTHTGDSPHRCKECGKGFKAKFLLSQHELKHHDLKPYYCLECNKQYISESDFENHMSNGSDSQCTQKCYNEHTLQNHLVKRIQNKSQKKCDVCNKSVAGSYFKAHMRSHTGEKFYRCHICGKGVTHLKTLKGHIARHTGEALYNCSVCEKRFTDYSNMRNHFRKFHVKGKIKSEDKQLNEKE